MKSSKIQLVFEEKNYITNDETKNNNANNMDLGYKN